MKKLVIAFAVVMMIAGGTISVLKWLGVGPFQLKESVEEVKEEAPPVGEPPRFIDMEALIIPLFKGDRVLGSIHIQVKLETLGDDNEAKIIRIMPRLGDAFLKDLYSFVPRMLRKSQRLDVALIKERLQMVGDRVAGAGVIKGVLVQSINEQRGR